MHDIDVRRRLNDLRLNDILYVEQATEEIYSELVRIKYIYNIYIIRYNFKNDHELSENNLNKSVSVNVIMSGCDNSTIILPVYESRKNGWYVSSGIHHYM